MQNNHTRTTPVLAPGSVVYMRYLGGNASGSASYKTGKRLPAIKLNEIVKMGKERGEGKMENEDKDLKSQMAVRRCAKAALLLSDLKSLPSLSLDDNEMLRREIEDLKIQLVKQRLISKRIKLCALSELIVQVILMLSLLSLILVLVLKTH